ALCTDTHPDVKRLVQQVKELERAAMEPRASVSSDETTSSTSLQAATIDSRANALVKQRETMQANLDKVEKSMADTVQVELGLAALSRQQEETQSAYRLASDKLAQAETGE